MVSIRCKLTVPEQEMKKYPKPTASFVYSILIFVVVATMGKVGFSKHSIPSFEPITWSQFIKTGLIKPLILSIVFFVLYYGYQLYRSFKDK
jgi:hypothetical protein